MCTGTVLSSGESSSVYHAEERRSSQQPRERISVLQLFIARSRIRLERLGQTEVEHLDLAMLPMD